jgi:Polyketide cyclase / dehydrase and lipid transport
VAPIVTSIEIARPPEDVFAYVIDPSRLTEWQESLLSSGTEGAAPPLWARGSPRPAASVVPKGP